MSVLDRYEWSRHAASAGSIAHVALRERSLVAAPRVLHDSLFRYAAASSDLGEPATDRALLVIPLHEGLQPLGVVAVVAPSGRRFDDRALGLAEGLLRAVGAILASGRCASGFFRLVANELVLLLGAESGAIYRLDRMPDALILLAGSDWTFAPASRRRDRCLAGGAGGSDE